MNNSIEAEQHLIACALVDDAKTAELLDIPEEWFSHNAHKLIIRTIRELANQSLSVDMFAVGDNLNRVGQLDMAGGMEYITELGESLPSLNFWGSYKNNLFNNYKLAQIESIKNNIQLSLSSGEKPQAIIEQMQGSLVDLLTDHHTDGFKVVGDYLGEVIDEMEWRENNKGQLLGQKSGFKELDFILDGFQKGRVYVIAGRPGMGKTAFGLALADGLTENAKPWHYFSLEMTGKSLAKRMLVRNSGVQNTKFRSGSMNQDELARIGGAIGVVQDRLLHVDQSPSLSIAKMRAKLKSAQVAQGYIGGIIVDHIGLIRKDPRKSDTEGMNIIADELLAMAKEFDCPLIELCQLNRGVEGRDDKRPSIAHLKQSGKIEENADVIMLLYRDDYYDENSEPVTEINIGKNRDGESKTVYLKHDMSVGQYTQMTDYEPPQQEQKRKL